MGLRMKNFNVMGVHWKIHGNILANGNISLKLFMAPLETTDLLIFWYVVAEHHFVQLKEVSDF